MSSTFDINSTAMIEARKSSPDWHGSQVLTGLVAFGSHMFQGERDAERISAMSPERKAKAVELMQRWSELHRDVLALNQEINDELQEGIE